MFKKYPSVYLLILVVGGIVLADQFRLPGWSFLLSCLLSTMFGVLYLGHQKIQVAIVLFGCALFCFSGYHLSIKLYDLAPSHVANFVSEKGNYQIFGKVADWPKLKTNRTEIKIKIDSLGREQRTSIKGSILLRISDSTTALQRGDRVEFSGRIYPLMSREDQGKFDYDRYLKLQGMFGVVYLNSVLNIRVDRSRRFGVIGAVDKIRKQITSSFKRNLSPASAALASGILIGETRDISPEIYNRFRDSGTLHLLAVSGSNVALVLIFLILILRPFSISRKKRAILLITFVFIFALLSYGEPSVVRAALMATLVLIAIILERRYDLNQIIATAALVILLVDPTQLFNVGFQLSFVTAWGLIFLTPKLVSWFHSVEHRIWFRWLILPILVSFLAQICSAPLIAFYFGRIPAISVIANLFIIPLVSVSVVGVLLLIVLDLIWPMLGFFFGSILDKIMNLVFYSLKLFGEEQTIIIKTGDISVITILLLYGLLLSISVSLFYRNIRKIAVTVALLLLNIGLALSIVDVAKRPVVTEYVDVFSLPGGIAAVVILSKSRPVDVVITGINSRDYPIEERVFEPMLTNLNVKTVNRVFVLSADYNAIDDILRLAQKFETKKIFVNSHLFNSFTDRLNEMSIDSLSLKVFSFPNKKEFGLQPGFYPESNKLTVDFGEFEVIFLNNLSTSGESVSDLSKPTTLVIGSIFDFNVLNSIQLLKDRRSAIICSKMKQRQNLFDLNGLKNRFHSLSTQGACRIIIPNSPNGHFELQSI